MAGSRGFSAAELAIVTSGYFVGFLSGARYTPVLIRRVGHVRVFAALGSFTSAGLIAFPLLAEPWAWTVLRLLLGFCMSGIYVVAESWLNSAATNETRGKVLSAYMMAQTLGIIGAQGLLALGRCGNFRALHRRLDLGLDLLRTDSPVHDFRPRRSKWTRPMSLRNLFTSSPLGTVGIFLLGSVYATQSGMGAVFGTQIGMSTGQIALFIAMLFAGALVLQYPIGWLSDQMDRRKLIFGAASLGAASCAVGWVTGGGLWPLMAAAFFAGGVTTPLYALLLAYTNDFLVIRGHAGGLGRPRLHLRVGRHCWPAGGRLGHAGAWSLRVLARAWRDLRRDRDLCALPHDAASGRSGRTDRKLPCGAAHHVDRRGGGSGRLGCGTGRSRTRRAGRCRTRRRWSTLISCARKTIRIRQCAVRAHFREECSWRERCARRTKKCGPNRRIKLSGELTRRRSWFPR